MEQEVFNPLDYSNKLQEAGVEKKQADIQAQLMGNILKNNINDQRTLDTSLMAEIKDIKAEVKNIHNQVSLISYIMVIVFIIVGFIKLFTFNTLRS